MSDINLNIYTGRLGQDPEIKFAKTGTAICNFSIAVNNDKKVNNEWVKDTLWLSCVAFGKTGEYIAEKGKKGVMVHVIGKLDISKYTTTTGDNRSKTQIIVNQFKMLEKVEKMNSENVSYKTPTKNQPYIENNYVEEDEEIIPF